MATDLFMCIELRFKFAHSGGVWTEGVIRPLSFNRHLHILYQVRVRVRVRVKVRVRVRVG